MIENMRPALGSMMTTSTQVMLANALTAATVLDGAVPTDETGAVGLATREHLIAKAAWNNLARPYDGIAEEKEVATRAWQCAEALSRTTLGFETLLARMKEPPPEGKPRDPMRAFLQAADVLAPVDDTDRVRRPAYAAGPGARTEGGL